jgi:hypothetical protein
MLNITFKFRDGYCTPDHWITRHCTVESVEECIKIYKLEESDVEYIITDIQEEK